MAEAAAAGFRSVINNRPDFEGGPTSRRQREHRGRGARRRARIRMPAGGAERAERPNEIARFAALLETLPKPILAFCRSGTRSGKLWQAARQR